MTTHKLARVLSQFSTALKCAPDTELNTFFSQLQHGSSKSTEASSDSVAVNLATLAALSRIGKPQWIELINQWQLPINVPSKDSARNIMGAVMNYLETHPDEIHRLHKQGSDKGSRASPALMKALSILMAGDNNEDPQRRD